MQQVLYILNILFPVFAILVIGFVLTKKNFLTPEIQKGLNKLAFFLGLSSLIFLKIAESELDLADTWRITVAQIVAMFISAGVAYVIAKMAKFPRPTIGATIQAGYRSNMFYIGIPILAFVFDGIMPEAEKNDLFADLFLGIMPVMICYNILAVSVLTIFSEDNKKPSALNIVFSVVKNPLIIAAVAGGVFAACHIPLPKMCARSLSSLAGLAFPLALLGIGSSLARISDFSMVRIAFAGTFVKLILSPIVCFIVAYFLGLRGYMLLATVLLTATPTAISSYIMADQMKCNSHLAAVAVAITTLLSFVTIAILLYIFSLTLGIVG